MLGVRALAAPCLRARVSVGTITGQPSFKALQTRLFTTAKQPTLRLQYPLGPRTILATGVTTGTCARPLVPARAYRGLVHTNVAQQPTVSQQLWRVAGIGALCGIGAVALDGLRESAAPGAYPSYVTERITKTYGYVVGTLGMTAGVATYIMRSGMYYRLASVSPLMMLGVTMVGTIGSMMAVQTVQNKPAQHAALVMFSGFMGLSLYPIAALGGALIQRAVMGTAAMVGSISLIAATTRSDAHLAMAGPLSVGLGVVFAASIGQLFLPASPLLTNVVLYGGLAVFGGLTYVDTQHMIQKAKYQAGYDPLKSSIGIYMDIVNIFWRMVIILGNGGQRKK